jgi:hypothetical protein
VENLKTNQSKVEVEIQKVQAVRIDDTNAISTQLLETEKAMAAHVWLSKFALWDRSSGGFCDTVTPDFGAVNETLRFYASLIASASNASTIQSPSKEATNSNNTNANTNNNTIINSNNTTSTNNNPNAVTSPVISPSASPTMSSSALLSSLSRGKF